jgi:vitamin B12 transporter
MRPCALLPVLAAMMAASTAAYAQTADTAPPVDSILVTATRLPTNTDDVAAGVDVIDAATIQQRGYTTLVDALSAVAGLQIVQSGGPGSVASVFIRGADSDQVQVLVDGVPVNDPSDPGGSYNFGVETLSNVARIEVVRGPMSAVYGSGAIGGVINIITTQPATTPHADFTIAGGVPAQLLGQADLSGRSGAFDYNLSAETFSDKGFDDTPRRETAVYTGERDGTRCDLGSLDLGYTPIEDTRLFFDLRGRSSVYGYDDVGYPAFDDPDETGRDNDTFARAGLQSTLLGGAWSTGLLIAGDQNYRHYVNLLDANDPNQAQENSRYIGKRLDLQWNNTIRLPNAGIGTDNALSAGYEHSNDTAIERLNSAYFGSPYLANVTASDNRDSGYLGAQTTLAKQLALTANIRDESIGGVGSAFTWRAGGSYAIPQLASHLKASYGTAFLAPSLYDRYGVDSDGYLGNPSLRPESSRGYEIGWVTDLAPTASIAATYFHTNLRNLIETQFVPVYTTVNVEAARLEGVETTVHYRPVPWLTADLTYTYTDARNTQTGQLLPRRPYNTASATLTLHPIPALSIVPQILLIGPDLDALVNDQGYPIGDGLKRGGVLLNLNATYQFSPAWRLFAWARNITDSHYEPASGYAGPGASFVAGIRAAY